MITFFACPKPFRGHIDVIQRNAIRSWMLLRPKPEIILLGADEGVAEACAEFDLTYCPDVETNEYGTPLVSSVFEIGQARASNNVVCYINADIMLTNEFQRAIEAVAARMPRFLAVGQRTDIDIVQPWTFEVADWEADLKQLAAQKGTLHAPSGIDFFCFPRGMYTEIPPFAIGRLKWDNWLVWRARTEGFPIVDVTEAVPLVHQNHGYAPDKLQVSGGRWVELGPEAQRNIALVPEEQNLNIWAATWAFDRNGRLGRRRIAFQPAYLYYQLKCVVPVYWPAYGRAFRRLVPAVKSLSQSLESGGRMGKAPGP
jgi:hypothetical protein